MTALAIGTLFACKGTEGSYFTIDVYGDYEGMEDDLAHHGHYNTSKATKIGFCYAVKNKKANTGGMQMLKDEKGNAYNYRHSFRDAGHGYEYHFLAFAGHYGDGTAINLDSITANCAIFTTFEKNNAPFLVTVRDAFGDLHEGFSDFVPYLTEVKQNADLAHALSHFPAHDPSAAELDPRASRDSYYINYRPLGWLVYEYDDAGGLIKYPGKDYKNAKGEAASDFLPYDNIAAIESYSIRNKTIFEAFYDDTELKTYTVTLSYQLRELDHYEPSGEAVYHYSDAPFADSLPNEIHVVYGSKLDLTTSAFTVDQYRAIGIGKDGKSERYDIDDPTLPLVLTETCSSGGIQYARGIAIVESDIRYNCSITVLYERYVSYTVRFHGNCSDYSVITTREVQEGAPATEPTVTNVPAGYVFTGEWTKTLGSLEPYDYSAITEDVDLYPVLIPQTVVSGGMTYQVELGYGGYLLSDVPGGMTALTPADLNPTLPERFPLIGVDSFGAGDDSLQHITLPSSIRYLSHGVFAAVPRVETIDITATSVTELHAHAFQNLIVLSEVRLPGTLTKLGADLFRGCIGNPTIYLDMTKEEAEAQKGFATDWNSGLPVDYKTIA